MKEYSKKYYIKNIDKEKIRLKEYKLVNKEAEKQRNIKWNFENREHINKRERERYKNDIQARLSNILRRRLGNAIKNNQKVGSAVSDLGCSIEQFKKYLESQFEPWMNWDNYGPYDSKRDTWNIDHIEALAKFDLTNTEQFKKACHYTNLRPYKAIDNIIKGDN